MFASWFNLRRLFTKTENRRARRRSKGKTYQPKVVPLEERVCPSTFYDYKVIAQSGGTTTTGGTISSFKPETSINDAGDVAVVGNLSGGPGTGTTLLFSDGTGNPKIISFAFPSSSRDFSIPQINNDRRVVVRDRVSGSPAAFFIRTWDANNPGSFTIHAQSGNRPFPQIDFDSVLLGTRAEDGGVAFVGLIGSTSGLYFADTFQDEEVAILSGGGFRAAAANDGTVIIRNGTGTTGHVVLYEEAFFGYDATTLASTSDGWNSVGRAPGISDDGKTAVWVGDITAAKAADINAQQPDLTPLTPGPGIFAYLKDTDNGDVYVRIAGVSGNGFFDPGETFDDANGNGIFDNGETDKGEFQSFDLDSNLGVTLRPEHLDAITVAYVGFDTSGNKGVYTSQIGLLPDSFDGFLPTGSDFFTISKPSVVAEVGQAINGLGTIQTIGVGDLLNNKGQLAFHVGFGGTDAILRATPAKTPVFIVPGIGGTFYNPDTIAYVDWLQQRGVAPDKMKLDPLLNSYDDLVQTLERAGYVRDKDLFIVNYDWRANPGPLDGQIDGHISGLSGASISDNVYEYGVDYLGHFLKEADTRWRADHDNRPLEYVDVLTHSTGGLVTRTYIQSDAYGDSLPKIDNFVMLAVPNRGASKAWNPIQNNWGLDPSFILVLSKILDSAYSKLATGAWSVIQGPTPAQDIHLEDITDDGTVNGVPDPLKFIALYCPTIRSLLATYDFLDDSLTGNGTLTNVNARPNDRNSFALDLNDGLDAIQGGDVRAFAQEVHTTAIYGIGEETPTRVNHWFSNGVGPDTPGILEALEVIHEIVPFSEYSGRDPLANEDWYEDVWTPNDGDGTVPLASLEYGIDSRIQVLPFQKNNIFGFGGNTSSSVAHTAITGNMDVQKQILNLLGAELDSAQISTDLASGQLSAVWNSRMILGAQLPLWSFIVDPIDAILIDGSGRRLGYTQATGPLMEIPGSMYFGGADGIGWIFDPVELPATIQITGIGGEYYVKLVGGQNESVSTFERRGTLALGEVLEFDVEITTNGTNPPTADAGGPYTVIAGGSVPLDASDSDDPDQDPATLTYLWDLDGDTVFGETGVDAEHGDEVGISPTFQAGSLAAGTLVTISLEVTDNGNLTSSTTASIEIQAAPIADAGGDYTVFEGSSVQLDASATRDDDQDFNTLTYLWDLDGDAVFGETGVNAEHGDEVGMFPTFDAGALAAGTFFDVFLEVTDDDNNVSDTVMATIEVQAVPNQRPTADAGGPYLLAPGSSLPLDASGSSDPDQDTATLTYIWDLDGDNIYGEIGNDAEHGDEIGISPTFLAGNLAAGTFFDVFLDVTDDGFLTSSATARIDIVDNQPPVANAGGPYALAFGGSVQLSGLQSSDPDQAANTLAYQWDLDNDGIFGETGVQAERGDETGSTPTFLGAGLAPGSFFDVFVEVTDDDGEQDFAFATINVQPPVYGFVMPAISEDATNPAGVLVSAVLGQHLLDADGIIKAGIAVAQTEGFGAWQYLPNGPNMKWTNIGVVSHTQARLLPSAYKIRFVPATNWIGEAQLYFRAWDGVFGKAGGTIAINATGGATSFSNGVGEVGQQVNPVNDAPIWIFTGIPVTFPNNAAVIAAGATVADVAGSLFFDMDFNADCGVAVVDLVGTTAAGTWAYSLDDGGTWTPFGTLPVGTARLLAADDKIRFLPNQGFTGKVTILARAWDGHTGTAGGTANLAGPGKTGGTTAFSANLLTATAFVNAAPTLGSAVGMAFNTNEDTPSAEVSIATLITSAQGADANGNTLGAAVVGATGPGTWQYSLKPVAPALPVWKPLGFVSEFSARLLTSTAKLRFIPAPNQSGQGTLIFRAWDQSWGTDGSQFPIIDTGGASVFSATEATSTLTVTAVNDAPTWSAATLKLTILDDQAAFAAGKTIAEVGASLFNDVDANAACGVAVVAFTGGGAWEYSVNGGANWIPFGAVSAGAARLLTANHMVRFLPSSNSPGNVTLIVHAWDGSTGTAGATADLTGAGKTGAATAFSLSKLTVTAFVNAAPTLGSATGPAPTTPEDKTSAAVAVTSLLTSAQAADTDTGAKKGVAIVGATGPGTWEYSLDGIAWKALGLVSQSSARLLTSTSKMRFIPLRDQNGQATLTYRAWDQTAGNPLTPFTIASTGGATAFSASTATSTLTINPVNDAPVVNAAVKPLLPPTLPGAVTPPSDVLANVLVGAITDVDASAVSGIAIVGPLPATGTWQYSIDNGANWINIAPVSSTSALLLRSSDRVRFLPNPGFVGTAILTFKAWDPTNELLFHTKVNATTGPAFSVATGTITALINTAPVLS